MQYRTIAKMVKKMGGKQGWLKQMQGGRRTGGAPMLPPGMSREQVMKMQSQLPPDIKAMLRQPGGREQLMKQMQSGQIPPSLAAMGGMPGLPGMGGGAMPDMAQMQQMMQNMGGLGGLGNMMRGMMGGGGA